MPQSPDPDLSSFIRPGDTIMWGQSHAEPRRLIRHLVEQRHEVGRVRVFLGIGLSGQLQPEHADAMDFLAYGGGGTTRKLAPSGALDILPVHYSRLPHLVRSGALRVDVMMLQVSPPDDAGRYSLGMAREYLTEPLKHARVVLAEVHPDVPWTHGGPYLAKGDFDLLLASDEDLPADAESKIDPVADAIGRNAASLIEDGATLQTGIGTIPDAVMAQLSDRRDLGVHTGSIGDGMACLHRSGAVTNARKAVDKGLSIGGVLMGGAELRAFAHRNPTLELRGTEYTHDPMILGQLGNFVAVNSAVEVDLTGQINSEVAGGRYVGAVGGIIDFLRAAGSVERGVPIVALPSTARDRSRIVAQLSGPVSVPRADSCVIVTEHGIADLRGLTLKQRVGTMIAVAHPDHREPLERAAKDGGML
ncbi:acetyl-CoA hydrolase/transferase family protein [Roseovarius indicus]|uniref:acetyl-CoA hydrolase/transferase family protein n=1 Tax=Roseovarius indicus TaxID=540747 RepID=UPI0032EFBF19